MVNMTETVELTFKAPEKMAEAAKVICEAFSMTLDEWLTNAMRGEIQCGFNNVFLEESEDLRQGIVDRVEVILGSKP